MLQTYLACLRRRTLWQFRTWSFELCHIDKPKFQSLVQSPNPKESNPKREKRIWTLGILIVCTDLLAPDLVHDLAEAHIAQHKAGLRPILGRHVPRLASANFL